ncbi:MAG TPA: hypothetical protein VK669_14700 [Candidatus Limnocylindrales bacterium]|nr:hypothetical protein [Candidatus Limnocylindrales bacterium]
MAGKKRRGIGNSEPVFGYVAVDRILGLLARSSPVRRSEVAPALGLHRTPAYATIRRLVRIGAVHVHTVDGRTSFVALDRAAVGSDALRALIRAVTPDPGVTRDLRRDGKETAFPDRTRDRDTHPIDLDGLFGSVIAGRALLLIRALGGASTAELAELLAKRDRPRVRWVLQRLVRLGVLRLNARSAKKHKPYVLDCGWKGATALRDLLDAHLDASPEMRRRAGLSQRAVGGKRGPPAPRTEREAAPHGLDAAPFFAPFLPPSQAKVILLLAHRSAAGSTAISAVLGIDLISAWRIGLALVKSGLATSAVSPVGRGNERWYSLTPAGKVLGRYLARVCPKASAPKSRSPAPALPSAPATSWRASAAFRGRQRSFFAILDMLVAHPRDVTDIARSLSTKSRRVQLQLDRLVRAGILAVAFPANVPTYAYDRRTKAGRAALALFSTP